MSKVKLIIGFIALGLVLFLISYITKGSKTVEKFKIYKLNIKPNPTINLQVNGFYQDHFSLPLNPYLKEGKNTIRVHMAKDDLFKQTDTFNLSFDNENGFLDSIDGIKEIKSSEEGTVLFEGTFEVKDKFPKWGYFNGEKNPQFDDLSDKDYYEFMDDFANIHRSIVKAIIDKKVDDILPLFEERSREIDIALNLKSGKTQEGLKKALNQFPDISKDDFLTLEKDYLNVNYWDDDNTLIRLYRNDSDAAIIINDKGLSHSYDMKFYKKNGRWIIAR